MDTGGCCQGYSEKIFQNLSIKNTLTKNIQQIKLQKRNSISIEVDSLRLAEALDVILKLGGRFKKFF